MSFSPASVRACVCLRVDRKEDGKEEEEKKEEKAQARFSPKERALFHQFYHLPVSIQISIHQWINPFMKAECKPLKGQVVRPPTPGLFSWPQPAPLDAGSKKSALQRKKKAQYQATQPQRNTL